MKKITFTIFAIALSISLFAQQPSNKEDTPQRSISKGAVLLSGSFSSKNNEKRNEIEKNLLVTFSTGIALSNHFTFNFEIGYQKDSYSTPLSQIGKGFPSYSSQTLLIVPGMTVYGNVSFGWLQPNLSIGIPIGMVTAINDDKFSTLGVALSPGLNIYLSNRLALSASMGLITFQKIDEGSNKTNVGRWNEFGFTPNDLSLGLIFIFGAK